MTALKKLQEIGILALVWVPIAVLALIIVERANDITGKENGVFALLAGLVLIAFVGTEYALEVVRADTSYSPD